MPKLAVTRPASLVALLLCAATIDLVAQSPPELLSMQGRLTNASGVPENGSRDIVVRFYDAAAAGNLLLTDSHTAAGGNAVTVTNGIYDLTLGGGTITAGTETTLGAVFRDQATVWVSLQVGADPEMSPRTRIVASGYAMNSRYLDGFSAADYVRVTGAVGELIYHNGTTWTALAAGTSGQALRSGGAGAPTWGTLSATYGGTGQNSSAWTGVPSVSAGAWAINSSLPVGLGGTGTTTAFTQGSVVFAGAGGVYAQDNANLFWDDTNNRLGVGKTGPFEAIDVVGRINANSDGASEDPVGFGAIAATSGPVGGSWTTQGTMSALCWSNGNYCFHGWSGPSTSAGGLLIELSGTGDAIRVADGGPTSFAVLDGGNVNLATGALLSAGTTRMTNAGVMQNTTWNGTAIATQYGGTGQNWSAVAAGSLPWFNAAGTMGTVAGPTAAGQFLRSTAANAFTWNTIQSGDVPAGSGNYVQNTTVAQTANYNVSNTGVGNPTGRITATTSGAGNIALNLVQNTALGTVLQIDDDDNSTGEAGHLAMVVDCQGITRYSLATNGNLYTTGSLSTDFGTIVDDGNDEYLRINQTSSYSSGIWFGTSPVNMGGGGLGVGSNGTASTAEVYIRGTYDGTNDIDLDGDNQRIDVKGGGGGLRLGANDWSDGGTTYGHVISDDTTYRALMIVGNNIVGNSGFGREVKVWDLLNVQGRCFATTDMRAPIFYDSDNTGFYVTPATNAGGSYSANFAGNVHVGGNTANATFGRWGTSAENSWLYLTNGSSGAPAYTDLALGDIWVNGTVQGSTTAVDTSVIAPNAVSVGGFAQCQTTSTSSSTSTDTLDAVTITPSNGYVLVNYTANWRYTVAGGYAIWEIWKGAGMVANGYMFFPTANVETLVNLTWLDTAPGTAAVTYRIMWRVNSGGTLSKSSYSGTGLSVINFKR